MISCGSFPDNRFMIARTVPWAISAALAISRVEKAQSHGTGDGLVMLLPSIACLPTTPAHIPQSVRTKIVTHAFFSVGLGLGDVAERVTRGHCGRRGRQQRVTGGLSGISVSVSLSPEPVARSLRNSCKFSDQPRRSTFLP